MNRKQFYLVLVDLLQRARNLGAVYSSPQSRGADCVKMGEEALAELERLVYEFAPSGSGFDAGTALALRECFTRGGGSVDQLVFKTAFHHMDSSGGYAGWTNHTVRVKPCFGGFKMTINGNNKNEIKEYLTDTFNALLTAEFSNSDRSTPAGRWVMAPAEPIPKVVVLLPPPGWTGELTEFVASTDPVEVMTLSMLDRQPNPGELIYTDNLGAYFKATHHLAGVGGFVSSPEAQIETVSAVFAGTKAAKND